MDFYIIFWKYGTVYNMYIVAFQLKTKVLLIKVLKM